METLFASKANPGEIYLTHTGAPLRVIGPSGSGIEIESLTTDNRMVLAAGALLQTYDASKLNAEARLLMKTKTGAQKNEAPKARMAEVEGRRTLTREYQGKEYAVTIHNAQDKKGFAYDGKLYRSLTDVARTITGQKIINGPKFFGLRNPKTGGK